MVEERCIYYSFMIPEEQQELANFMNKNKGKFEVFFQSDFFITLRIHTIKIGRSEVKC